MTADNPNLHIPTDPPADRLVRLTAAASAAPGEQRQQLLFLAAFCRGLALSRRFAFDGNERDALRRVSELLLDQAEKKS